MTTASDDVLGHVEREVARRLASIGCTVRASNRRADRNGRALEVQYLGRDEQGHAASLSLAVHIHGDIEASSVENKIDKALRSQERRALIAQHLPPVALRDDMPLSHLEVTMPYARRLRLDHGAQAQQALRHSIRARLAEKGVRAYRSAVAHQPSFNCNRIDHREEMAPGVHLRGEHLIIANTTLPEQLAIALPGRSVTAICTHPILGEDDIVGVVGMTNPIGFHGKRTVTLKLAPNWLRADQI